MDYEGVIGLEVHSQLKTKSKIFCGCSTEFGSSPNSQTCPVCLGLPGVLPVLNKQAVYYGIKAALSLNCSIAKSCHFHRKNYFYPDLPKAYQISQYDEPLAVNGYLDIMINGMAKRIGITRAHLEEDAGKLVHSDSGYSLVDFNRCGMPLLEIVSKPDLATPQEAYLYLSAIKAILEYTETSDCNMEQGSLRCDANVSVRYKNNNELGVKVEIKNLNSFKAVEKALEYEISRQIEVLSSNRRIIQETRLWDEKKQVTYSMRGKEEAHDYRYFPDPDLVSLTVTSKWMEEIRDTLPELPQAKQSRFINEYGLPEYDASVLTAQKNLAQFYEETVKLCSKPKMVSNWIMTELLGALSESCLSIENSLLSPEHLSEMIILIDNGTISGKIGKEIFTEMFKNGKKAQQIIQEKGLVQISNEDEIIQIVNDVILENPKAIKDYLSGKLESLGFLVGQIMKKSKGKANPQLANKFLRDRMRDESKQ